MTTSKVSDKINSIKQKYLLCCTAKESLGAVYKVAEFLGDKELQDKVIESLGGINEQIKNKGKQLEQSIIVGRRLLGRPEADQEYWTKLVQGLHKTNLQDAKDIWRVFFKGSVI